MAKTQHDFAGWATKNDLECSDGRVIRHGAFKNNDGNKVPLVWRHDDSSPNNILGHALLENRDNGVYCFGYFNSSEQAKTAKELVTHGDISALSIRANKLVQNGADVMHGNIIEVSLVMAGANPGAYIEDIAFAHGDEEDPIESIIYTGANLMTDDVTHETEVSDEETIGDILATMSEKQKNAMYYVIGSLASDGDEEDSDEDSDETKHTDQEDTLTHHNVFEGEKAPATTELTHEQKSEMLTTAISHRSDSFKSEVLAHAGTYGINQIDVLFPDANAVRKEPDFIKRETDWVAGVLSGTHHTAFSRIKSMAADITADEARAKGYVKGNKKKEEVFKLLKRVTTPTTVYKKQKFDRDDLIDITWDIIPWVKGEMRLMMDEELARAFLVGDGRDAGSDDKINEENIRPIWKDDEMYSHKVSLEANVTPEEFVDATIRHRHNYKGSGSPTLFVSQSFLTDLLLIKEKNTGKRMYGTEAELAAAMRVSRIVEVPVFDGLKREGAAQKKYDLLGIMVNLKDYTVGADKGGELNMFDDFDIDFNQYKYLLETRISGTLTRPKSALVFEKAEA